MNTTSLGLKKPEGTDPVDIQDFNDNADIIDEELKKRPEKTGSASDMTTAFSPATSRTNLTSGESLKTSLGKIMRWFSDLKSAAFSAVANNLTTTAAGSVLDARQGKTLKDSVDTINTNLNGKATIGTEVCFSGVHIGGDTYAFPYIYSENNNINFRYKDANGNDAYFDLHTLISELGKKAINGSAASFPTIYLGSDNTALPVIVSDENGNINFRFSVDGSNGIWSNLAYIHEAATKFNNFIIGAFAGDTIVLSNVVQSPWIHANTLVPYTNNYLTLAGSNNSEIFNNARIEVKSDTTANNSQIRMYTGDSAIVYNYRDFYPTHEISLGTASYKWACLYALNGTIQTSDRNKKNDIESLNVDLIKAFIMGLKPSSYKMIDGTSGRTHYGFIAQDVEELMESLEMSSLDFAGFIKSPRTEIEDVLDADGNVVETRQKVIDGEYEYALRYDEFIAPAIQMIQLQQNEINTLKDENKKMQERMDKLEERLTELEKLL